MKRIKLSQGKYALIDDEDYGLIISRGKWSAALQGKWYAVSHKIVNGKRTDLKMHRLVMLVDGLGKHIFIDHIDGNTLNNQKKNLRVCNASQNAMSRIAIGGASKYKGVSVNGGYWLSRIGIKGKRINLGYFPKTKQGEIDAAKAYDEAAKKYHKEFAVLNFKP